MTTPGDGIRVLLVDDDPEVTKVTRLHLERAREGFDVTVANGATDALAALDGTVDCVVSDYEMPDVDGLAFLRQVRDRDETLPFVLFTGRGSEEIASEAISAGVTDYLQKGTGADQYEVLANRIENAVARRRSEATAAETQGRYRTLVEESPNAILVHDGERISYVNDRFVELAGADRPDDVYGADPVSFVHPDDRSRLGDRIQRIIRDGERTGWLSWRLSRLDGGVRCVESRGAPVMFDGTRSSQVVIRDLTDRRDRERQIEALHEATHRLYEADSRTRVATVTLDVLDAVLDESIAAVWGYDPDRDGLFELDATARAVETAGEDAPAPDDDPLPEWSVEAATYEAGEPRVVTDYRDRDDAITDAFETAFLVPLDAHGLLAVAATESRSFEPAERDVVGILARSVTAALDSLDGN